MLLHARTFNGQAHGAAGSMVVPRAVGLFASERWPTTCKGVPRPEHLTGRLTESGSLSDLPAPWATPSRQHKAPRRGQHRRGFVLVGGMVWEMRLWPKGPPGALLCGFVLSSTHQEWLLIVEGIPFVDANACGSVVVSVKWGEHGKRPMHVSGHDEFPVDGTCAHPRLMCRRSCSKTAVGPDCAPHAPPSFLPRPQSDYDCSDHCQGEHSNQSDCYRPTEWSRSRVALGWSGGGGEGNDTGVSVVHGSGDEARRQCTMDAALTALAGLPGAQQSTELGPSEFGHALSNAPGHHES